MSQTDPIIQVFIATCNRSDIVSRAINSAVNQTYKSIEIIVSDNSTNNKTEKVVNQIQDKRIIYIRRHPQLPPITHFNSILQEVKSEFFMIFHDDDVMLPNMIEKLYNAFQTKDTIIATGANAYRNINNKTTKKLFLKSQKGVVITEGVVDMANRYLQVNGGIVPFPSYLYKKKVAESMLFDVKQGGKYCDAAFIIKLLYLGHVTFICAPLMIYYNHKKQDSQANNFQDRLKFIKFLQQSTGYNKNHYRIRKYRIMNIHEELRVKVRNNDIQLFSKYYNKLVFIYASSFGHLKAIRLILSNLYQNYIVK